MAMKRAKRSCRNTAIGEQIIFAMTEPMLQRSIVVIINLEHDSEFMLFLPSYIYLGSKGRSYAVGVTKTSSKFLWLESSPLYGT